MEEIIELLVDEKSHIPEGKVGLDFFAKGRLMNVSNSEFIYKIIVTSHKYKIRQ